MPEKQPDFGTSDPAVCPFGRCPGSIDAGRLDSLSHTAVRTWNVESGRCAIVRCGTAVLLQPWRPLLALALQLSRPSWPRILATPLDVVERMLTLAGWDHATWSTTWDAATAASSSPPRRSSAREASASTSIRHSSRRRRPTRKKAGVERRVTFRVQDAMTVDVSDATVVTLYLLPRRT